MGSTARWGITLPLRSMPLAGQRDFVAALPDLGYTDAWSSEVNGADGFSPLVHWDASTRVLNPSGPFTSDDQASV